MNSHLGADIMGHPIHTYLLLRTLHCLLFTLSYLLRTLHFSQYDPYPCFYSHHRAPPLYENNLFACFHASQRVLPSLRAGNKFYFSLYAQCKP